MRTSYGLSSALHERASGCGYVLSFVAMRIAVEAWHLVGGGTRKRPSFSGAWHTSFGDPHTGQSVARYAASESIHAR